MIIKSEIAKPICFLQGYSAYGPIQQSSFNNSKLCNNYFNEKLIYYRNAGSNIIMQDNSMVLNSGNNFHNFNGSSKYFSSEVNNSSEIKHKTSNKSQSISTRKKPFSSQEDDLLITLVEKHGIGNWQKISRYMEKYNFHRNGRQCRDRYYHYLDPNICNDSPWTNDEDLLILKFVQDKGRKWKVMEKVFPGRTEVSIRNRYNLLIRKIAKEERKAGKNLSDSDGSDNSEIKPNENENENFSQTIENKDNYASNDQTSNNDTDNEYEPKVFQNPVFNPLLNDDSSWVLNFDDDPLSISYF